MLLLLLSLLRLSRFSCCSGTFRREQVAPRNQRSLGLVLQFLQFQTMLLFAKALYYSLHQTSSATSLSVFSVLLIGLQLQLEQPIIYLFLFFQLNLFVPRHSSINKVILSFGFVQHN